MPRFDLLAVDLDGTLFDSFRRVPEENRRALAQAVREGVRVVVVTGRRLPAALPSLRGLDIEPVLVFNSGAFIKEGLAGPILRRRFLPRRIAKRVLAVGREAGVAPLVHDGPDGEGYILIESAPTNPSLTFYLEKTSPPPRLVADLTERMERDPVQIGFVPISKEIRLVESRLAAEAFDDELALARTEYAERDFAMLDVLSPEATKAEAIKFLAIRYGTPPDRIMAIGDNWNDLQMLEAAGLGVLMANAPKELHSRGFASTGVNDEAGVAQAIYRYLL
jgi:Cof subfamily protein (haloacid dehalogenase superfamily)